MHPVGNESYTTADTGRFLSGNIGSRLEAAVAAFSRLSGYLVLGVTLLALAAILIL